MTNLEATSQVWRHCWGALVSMALVTGCLSLLFLFLPELTGLGGSRWNRWTVTALAFLAFINLGFWMKLINQAKGRQYSARWWISATENGAIACLLAIALTEFFDV